MNTFFSYIPWSGSRVVAIQTTPKLAIAELKAGTKVAGDLITIALNAAVPGNHYRDAAVRFAKELIPLVGGLAEDKQGIVTLVVPRDEAFGVLRLIDNLLPLADTSAILKQLWQQNAAWLTCHDPESYVAKDRTHTPPVECVPGWKTRLDGERLPAVYVDGHAITDAGRHFTVQRGEEAYHTPSYDVMSLRLDVPYISKALYRLGVDPLDTAIRPDSFITDAVDGLSWYTGNHDTAPYIYVDRTPETESVFDDLVPYASTTNYNLPAWAGWE